MTTYPFRTALVTGASSGIGEAIAHELGRDGVATVVVARRRDRLDDLAAAYPDFEVLAADLTELDGQHAVADRIRSVVAPIDLVVNNAGFGTSGTFHELDADRLADEVELNVGALTRLSHAALEVMVPRSRGWLLNVSSVASFQAAPLMAVYAATKAFVTSLSESLHEEVRDHGVVVTALCPGLTRTEFQRVSNTQRYEDRYPDFVWTTVDEVAIAGLRAVAAGRATSVPGMFYKSMVLASEITPRAISRRLSGLIQRS